ncbi:MAG TPA: hypothetical protein VGJ99_03485 [Actinomycetota bacterium]
MLVPWVSATSRSWTAPRGSGYALAPVRRIFELTATDHPIADTDRPPNCRGTRPTAVTR